MPPKRKLSDGSTNSDKNSSENYKWIGPILKEERNLTHYGSIAIKNDVESYNISVGDTVLFNSEKEVPYIAIVESLYENKFTKEKGCKARWFFRTSDVKESISNALDRYPPFPPNEIFYSASNDNNQVESILRPCVVNFAVVEDPYPTANRNRKEVFVCRYRFDVKKGLIPLKKSDVNELTSAAVWAKGSSNSILHGYDSSSSSSSDDSDGSSVVKKRSRESHSRKRSRLSRSESDSGKANQDQSKRRSRSGGSIEVKDRDSNRRRSRGNSLVSLDQGGERASRSNSIDNMLTEEEILLLDAPASDITNHLVKEAFTLFCNEISDDKLPKFCQGRLVSKSEKLVVMQEIWDNLSSEKRIQYYMLVKFQDEGTTAETTSATEIEDVNLSVSAVSPSIVTPMVSTDTNIELTSKQTRSRRLKKKDDNEVDETNESTMLTPIESNAPVTTQSSSIVMNTSSTIETYTPRSKRGRKVKSKDSSHVNEQSEKINDDVIMESNIVQDNCSGDNSTPVVNDFSNLDNSTSKIDANDLEVDMITNNDASNTLSIVVDDDDSSDKSQDRLEEAVAHTPEIPSTPFLGQSRSTRIARIGPTYQVDDTMIPEVIPDISNGALVFDSDVMDTSDDAELYEIIWRSDLDQNDVLSWYLFTAHKVLDAAKAAIPNALDGSLWTTIPNCDDKLIQLLSKHRFQAKPALDEVKSLCQSLLVQWTKEEQKSIVKVCAKHGENIAMLRAAVPSKTNDEIFDFYFRYVYSAHQLEHNNAPSVTRLFAPAGNTSHGYSLKPRIINASAYDKEIYVDTETAISSSRRNRRAREDEVVPEAGDDRGESNQTGSKPNSQLMAFEYLVKMSKMLSSGSFVDLLNSLICLDNGIITPSELMVRVHGICQENVFDDNLVDLFRMDSETDNGIEENNSSTSNNFIDNSDEVKVLGDDNIVGFTVSNNIVSLIDKEDIDDIVIKVEKCDDVEKELENKTLSRSDIENTTSSSSMGTNYSTEKDDSNSSVSNVKNLDSPSDLTDVKVEKSFTLASRTNSDAGDLDDPMDVVEVCTQEQVIVPAKLSSANIAVQLDQDPLVVSSLIQWNDNRDKRKRRVTECFKEFLAFLPEQVSSLQLPKNEQ